MYGFSYFLNGQRVAQERDGVFTWIHADHLSSAMRITDVNGLEIRRLAYAAFGEEAENQGSGDEPKYKYTGKEQDSSGLYYSGARYYDPALSRFITADSVYDAGPQGLNRYSYALNNPILYRDPTGHYIDADFDPDYVRNSGADENGYGDGPTASGNVTGSAQHIHEGTATVHNYYGTHPLAYWQGLAGGPEPSMTAWEIAQAGGMLFACAAGPVGFAVSVAIAPYQQVAAEYYRERGYNTVATVVEHGDIVIGMGVEVGITKAAGIFDDVVEAGFDDVVEEASKRTTQEGYVRAIPENQVGTSQGFKIRKGKEIGISVFEDVSPEQVLKELPGDKIPNTTVIIPKGGLPPGTQVIPELDPTLSKVLSEAHRNLVPPEGMSAKRFAKLLKKAVGWE